MLGLSLCQFSQNCVLLVKTDHLSQGLINLLFGFHDPRIPCYYLPCLNLGTMLLDSSRTKTKIMSALVSFFSGEQPFVKVSYLKLRWLARVETAELLKWIHVTRKLSLARVWIELLVWSIYS